MVRQINEAINYTINELSHKMSALDLYNNDSIFDKLKNGRAATSAEEVCKMVDVINDLLRSGTSLELDLTALTKRKDDLQRNYEQIRDHGGFIRTLFWCFGSRNSNTQAKIKKALDKLGALINPHGGQNRQGNRIERSSQDLTSINSGMPLRQTGFVASKSNATRGVYHSIDYAARNRRESERAKARAAREHNNYGDWTKPFQRDEG